MILLVNAWEKTMKSLRLDKIRPERFLAILIAVMGMINVFSAIVPALHDRLVIIEEIFPLEIRAGTRLATAFAGFVLLQLASGIWRQKRVAWYLTLTILVVSFVGHLVKGLDVEEATFSLILILAMIIFRKRFYARSDQITIKKAVWVVASAVLFTFIYGTLGFFILDRHFSVSFNLPLAAIETSRMFSIFANTGAIPTTRFGKYFYDSIYAIGISTMTYALLAILAPVLIHSVTPKSDHERAEMIIKAYGKTVLARFNLFDDKHYFFSKGGTLFCYVQVRRTCAVLGDPIGPKKDIFVAIQEFQNFCKHNDWLVCFYQTLPDNLEAYQKEGLKYFKIGQEANVDLQSFTLEGSDMKPLRNIVSKMERSGYTCQLSEPPHSAALLDALELISSEWLKEHKSKEMKYSLGWFDRDYLNTTPIITLFDVEKNPVAFVNLVDEYQKHGMAVDLMRHKTDRPSGTMDYLFVTMLKQAQIWQYKTFNLGLSGLVGVGESADDPVIERAMHFIYSNVSTTYNFRGLHNFKQKFNPDWSPRYLVYPDITSLPTIALALSEISA
jgi:phosphatidylglycerol lysyltransferase